MLTSRAYISDEYVVKFNVWLEQFDLDNCRNSALLCVLRDLTKI